MVLRTSLSFWTSINISCVGAVSCFCHQNQFGCKDIVNLKNNNNFFFNRPTIITLLSLSFPASDIGSLKVAVIVLTVYNNASVIFSLKKRKRKKKKKKK